MNTYAGSVVSKGEKKKADSWSGTLDQELLRV